MWRHLGIVFISVDMYLSRALQCEEETEHGRRVGGGGQEQRHQRRLVVRQADVTGREVDPRQTVAVPLLGTRKRCTSASS